MADLFTHAVVGLVIAIVLSWRYEWVTRPVVAAAVVGAILPDLNRIDLVLPEVHVQAITGVPWSWTVLHRVGGTALVICLLAMLVGRRYRHAVVVALLLGAASHYVLDGLLWQPSGMAGPLAWPFTDWRPVVDGFYRSSDRWPAMVAAVTVAVVLVVDRYVGHDHSGPGRRTG